MTKFRSRFLAAMKANDGIGLVEIIVSMFMLSLVAVSFLPLLIQGIQTSVANGILTTASEIASKQMDSLRAVGANCLEVTAYGVVPQPIVTDSRGTKLQPQRLVDPCPVSYPGTVKVRAWVTEVGKTKVLADATTLMLVEKAIP